MDPLLLSAAWAVSSVHLPSLVACFAFAFSWFPDGHSLSRRWTQRAVAGDDRLRAGHRFDRPVAGGPRLVPVAAQPVLGAQAYAPLLTAIGGMGLALAVVGVVIAAASIAVRYRHSDGEERAQIRWIAIAVLSLPAPACPS